MVCLKPPVKGTFLLLGRRVFSLIYIGIPTHSFTLSQQRADEWVVLFDLLLREVKSGVRVNSVRELVLSTGGGQSQLPTL